MLRSYPTAAVSNLIEQLCLVFKLACSFWVDILKPLNSPWGGKAQQLTQ